MIYISSIEYQHFRIVTYLMALWDVKSQRLLIINFWMLCALSEIYMIDIVNKMYYNVLQKEVTNYKQSRDFWKIFWFVKMGNLNKPSEYIVFQIEAINLVSWDLMKPLSIKVDVLPLQCIDDSNKLFCHMSNSYSMWFAFSAFLGIVSCKCHVKTD